MIPGRANLHWALISAFLAVLGGCESETEANKARPGEAISSAMLGASFPTISEAGCDADRALKVFEQCKVCHSVQRGAANLAGPNLFGIVGRKAASLEGLAYSKVLRESGIVWDVDTLDAFLARPLEFLPNNRMAFGGVTNTEDRQAIICFLTTLS